MLAPLGPDPPLLPGVLERAGPNEVVIADRFRPDEPGLEIGVHDARRLGRQRAAPDRPGPHLFLVKGEEGDQSQKRIGGPDQAFDAGSLESQLAQVLGPLLRFEIQQLRLEAATEPHGRVGVHRVRQLPGPGRLAGQLGLGDVGHIEDRLPGEQEQRGQDPRLLGIAFDVSGRRSRVQPLGQTFQKLGLTPGVTIAAPRHPLHPVETPCHRFEVGEEQLGPNGLDVANRVHRARRVRDVRVVEAAHHVDQRFDLPNMSQEPVSQPLPLVRALDEPGDIEELDHRRHLARRLDQLEEPVQPEIRHLDHADVGIDRGERVGFGGHARGGERVEQRRLAGVGETHYAGA